MAMNARELRIIDPILTGVVQGFKNSECVGEALFPRVPVTRSGGKIIAFGKESFKRYNTLRAPGAAVKLMEWGYSDKPYSLSIHALGAKVPREHQREADVPGIDLAQKSAKLVMDTLLRELECEQAALATDPANYSADHRAKPTGDAKWSSPKSDPKKDIESAKEVIRKTIGARPNTMLLSAAAYNALKDHPEILKRYISTTSAVVTTDMLQSLFDIPKIVVGEMVMADETKSDALYDVWGRHAVLAYVPPVPSSAEEPSYAYTYTMEGHPLTEEPYWDPMHLSWIYRVSFEHSPVIAGMDAGFLFQDVG